MDLRRRRELGLVALVAVLLSLAAIVTFKLGLFDGLAVNRVKQLAQDKRKEWKNRWFGIPLQQYPSDLLSYQELIYRVQPDVIVETGTLAGGGTIYLSMLLEFIKPTARIITVDIDPQHWSKTSTERRSDLGRLLQRITLVSGDSLYGRHVTVIEPVGINTIGTSAVVDALATLPEKATANIDTVVLSPHRNHKDPFWEQHYGRKGFISAATGGGRTVTFYPAIVGRRQNQINGVMAHEAGHIVHQEAWTPQLGLAQWEDAMRSDYRSVSGYADTNWREDFAESTNMYSATKGTECEDAARKLYPARYQMLDQLTAPDSPPGDLLLEDTAEIDLDALDNKKDEGS